MDSTDADEASIRRARPGDIAPIHALWHDMMDYHRQFDPRFALDPNASATYREYMRNALENHDYLVLVAEAPAGQVVGYCLAMVCENSAVFILPRYGFIAEMMVLTDWRRQGLGDQFWDRLRAWFTRKGVGVVQLNVSTLNTGGQLFWRHLGFRDFLHVLWCDLEREDA